MLLIVCTRRAVKLNYGLNRHPLAVMEANADSLVVTEALHTSCDQSRCTGDGRTTIHKEISQLYHPVPSMWGSLRLAPITFPKARHRPQIVILLSSVLALGC